MNKDYLQEINRLEGIYSNRMFKWRDNLRLYQNRFNIELNDLKDDYSTNLFSATFGESDMNYPIQENIIKSCVETLVSKIASQKAHPFFSTVNGSFKDIQIVKEYQHFVDVYFPEINVNKIVSDAFRDACIFNTGVVYINRGERKVERVMPWQVFIDPSEYSYNHLTKAVYKRTKFPVSLIRDAKLYKEAVKHNIQNITYYLYWDLNDGKLITFVPELDYTAEETLPYNQLPFIFIFYDTPVKGTNGLSIPDLLRGIQIEINNVVRKIREACDLSPAMTYFVPENSTIKTSKLTNRTGEIVTYTPTGDGGSPVTVATPAFVDPQNIEWLAALKQDAYELVGISQLSATSQKPQGLNSGIALQSMEDIESDRFETQLNSVIRLYTDIAKAILNIFPADEPILPKNIFRGNITWGDIVNLRDDMSITFNSIDSLSKDPSTKLQQIQALVSAGYVSQARAGQLLQMPDLETGYTFANSSENAVLKVIDNCIYNNSYEIPFFVSNDLLCEEIIKTLQSLYGNGGDEEAIARLTKLFEIADNDRIDSQTQAELAAQQQLGQEIQQQMPQIQQQAQNQMNDMINQTLGGVQ
jgi:hypothetical protein